MAVQGEAARPPASAAGGRSVPDSPERAGELWRRHRKSALPELERYFAGVDWKGGDVQKDFELLREISVDVSPGEPEDRHVLAAMRSFLGLGLDRTVSLPGEQFRAPWQVILRLVLGLRPGTTLGPILVEEAEKELRRFPDGSNSSNNPSPRVERQEPEPSASPRLRNAAYTIAFLRYLPGIEVLGRFARMSRGKDRYLALELLGSLGLPSSAPLLQEVLASSRDLPEVAAAARSLRKITGDGAEPYLLPLLRRDDPDIPRAAILPLLAICSPSALREVVGLYERSPDRTLKALVEYQLNRYARALRMEKGELESLIRKSPEEASRKMYPFAHRLEVLAEDDRRLPREDLPAVLDLWRVKGTIYTGDWSWVRDRHIIHAAAPGDIPRLEAVRMAILREYRTTCVNEAEIIQRIIGAVQKAHLRGGESERDSKSERSTGS